MLESGQFLRQNGDTEMAGFNALSNADLNNIPDRSLNDSIRLSELAVQGLSNFFKVSTGNPDYLGIRRSVRWFR
jgi:hypothetical protein